MGGMRGGGMGMGMRAEAPSHGRGARVGQADLPKTKPNLKKLWPESAHWLRPARDCW